MFHNWKTIVSSTYVSIDNICGWLVYENDLPKQVVESLLLVVSDHDEYGLHFSSRLGLKLQGAFLNSS